MRVEGALSLWAESKRASLRNSVADTERDPASEPSREPVVPALPAEPSTEGSLSPRGVEVAGAAGSVSPLSEGGGGAASSGSGTDGLKALEEERTRKRLGLEPCETCENRRYQDDSDDSSVSFQTPTKLTPQQAAMAVPAHEGEHVHNEQARADRDGRKVISQSVRIHTSICPECGRVYVSGGTTTTVTASETPMEAPSAGENGSSSLDLVA